MTGRPSRNMFSVFLVSVSICEPPQQCDSAAYGVLQSFSVLRSRTHTLTFSDASISTTRFGTRCLDSDISLHRACEVRHCCSNDSKNFNVESDRVFADKGACSAENSAARCRLLEQNSDDDSSTHHSGGSEKAEPVGQCHWRLDHQVPPRRPTHSS